MKFIKMALTYELKINGENKGSKTTRFVIYFKIIDSSFVGNKTREFIVRFFTNNEKLHNDLNFDKTEMILNVLKKAIEYDFKTAKNGNKYVTLPDYGNLYFDEMVQRTKSITDYK